MDERLIKLVDEYFEVDYKMLCRLTIRTALEDAQSFPWHQVRYLYVRMLHSTHIVSPVEEILIEGFESGIYSSPDGQWVFVENSEFTILPNIFSKCGERLEYLRINESCFEQAVDLRHLCNLKVFTCRGGAFFGIDYLHNLEELILEGVDVHKLDFSNLVCLRVLSLQRGYFGNIQGLNHLKELRTLKLDMTSYDPTLDISRLSLLKSLWIVNYEESYVLTVDGIFSSDSLEELGCFGVEIAGVCNVSQLPSLKSLCLMESKGLRRIEGLRQLSELEVLTLNRSGIRNIPDDIRHLNKLQYLGLAELDLAELPFWLPELGLTFHHKYTREGINLRDTKVSGVDMSIFDQPHDMILKWFEDLKRKSMIPLQEVKVVFLGDGEAGKTHTIARLLNDGNPPKDEDFDNKATPGIVIKDKSYDLDGKTVNVHFWDFGGQEILHSMHRMFLTERTLYVVLLNARDDTQDDRARYWLHNIRSFAGESPVLLVLNKIDQNPNANVNEPELKELYGGLRQVVSLSALEYTPEQFNATLTDALKEEIRALGTVGTLWPASWAKLKTGLETMQSKYITGTQYKQMCLDSGVDKNQKDLLHWFNDLGVSFCYEGNRRLEHYVILRPEWITNGIYILLFNKSDETKNGVIPKQVIYEMLDPEDENAYRRVLGGVTYDVNETEYVLEVMRKFRLSYAVSDRAEFIPALCQRNSMPIATEYANDPNALEFCLTYAYLPDNVIHRLMVEMRQDLQLSDVWRTGALFRQTGTGLSAVVKSEGDVLRIFVRSDNALHQPNTYLCILKENIDRINRDMKLAAPFAEVVYKTARGKELFDYEDLLNAFEEGREGYRSKKLRRDIPIQDILNQTGRGAELALEKLRDDILTACLQMQQNRSFWTANEEDRIEDERNTYLRDTLINLRYKVSDQHLQGLGGGSRGYGELDLDIRRESAIPWTILEALRIKDSSKTDWNRHLKKLLDNYNPSGMRHLFLLTYVDCSKDDFEEIVRKFSEHIEWHDEGAYVRLENTFSHIPLPGFGDPHYLKVMRCTYDRSGAPTTVTHIFVRMGE